MATFKKTRAARRLLADTSLNLKLATGLILISLLAVGATLGLSNSVAERGLSDAAGAALRDEAAAQADIVAATLGRHFDALHALALTDTLAQAAQGDAAASDRAADALARFAEAFPILGGLLLTDGRGQIVAAADGLPAANQSGASWWREAWADGSGARHLGRAEPDQGGVLHLPIALPVRNRDGQAAGVLYASYDLSAVAQRAAAVQIGRTGGVQIWLPPAQLLGADGRAIALAPTDATAIAALPDATYRQLTYQGVYRFVARASVDTPEATSGWHVVIFQDEDEVLETIAATTWAAALGGLAVVAVTIVLAILLARLIAAPLHAITAAAGELAGGDLSRRVTLGGNDEFGRLALSFNLMADALAERIAAERAARGDQLRQQEALLAFQDERLRELATPVIPLGRNTLLVPLIGAVDRPRAAQLLTTLLGAVSGGRSLRVLLDLTGVSKIEPDAAASLTSIAASVRLLGAHTALVGVRPAVAPELAGYGLADELPAFRDLEGALAALYERPHV